MAQRIASQSLQQEGQKQEQTPSSQSSRRGVHVGPYAEILALQGTVGNRAVSQLLRSPPRKAIIQTKLTVGKPGDKYEQEADRVAEAVLHSAGWMNTGISKAPLKLQGKCATCAQGQGLCPKCAPEEDVIQRQPLASTMTPAIQRQREPSELKAAEEARLQTNRVTGHTPEITPDIEPNLNALRAGGEPLSESVRAFFEARFSYDFSQVRVRTDPRAATALNARAFTLGRTIVFGAGQYAPGTTEGRRLLAHELVHTIQQRHSPMSQGILQRQPRTFVDCTRFKTRTACMPHGVSVRNCRLPNGRISSCVWGGLKYGCLCRGVSPPPQTGEPSKIKDLQKITVLLALIAAAAALMKQWGGGRRLVKGYAYLSALASVLLLVTGRAEASLTEGEEPLEALIKHMADRGVKVPPDVAQMLRSDPELAKLLEEAARNKDVNAAIEETTKKILKILEQYGDEFTRDDLEILLSVQEAAGELVPTSELTAQKLHQMIEQRKAGVKPGLHGETDKGSSRGDRDRDALEKRTKEISGKRGKGKGRKDVEGKQNEALSQGEAASNVKGKSGSDLEGRLEEPESSIDSKVRRRLEAAKPSVRLLYQFMTDVTQGARGAHITSATLERFLDIVPKNLSSTNLQKIVNRLMPILEQSIEVDEILDTLEAVVRNIETIPEEPIQAPTARGSVPASKKKLAAAKLETLEEQQNRIIERMKRFNWSTLKFSEGRFVYNADVKTTEPFAAVFYYRSEDDIRVSADVTAIKSSPNIFTVLDTSIAVVFKGQEFWDVSEEDIFTGEWPVEPSRSGQSTSKHR